MGNYLWPAVFVLLMLSLGVAQGTIYYKGKIIASLRRQIQILEETCALERHTDRVNAEIKKLEAELNDRT